MQPPFQTAISRQLTRLPMLLLLGVMTASAIVLWRSEGRAEGWPWEARAGISQSQPGRDLAAYRVEIEAKPLAGVSDDVSGLTYDPSRDSLFAITNQRSEILELSLHGDVLRRIPVAGLEDPEAIEYIGPGQFVVADERSQTLVAIRIDDGTQRIDAATARKLSIGMGRNGNKGFEGLAYDRAGHRLFVAKERNPLRIYEVTGFAETAGDASRALQIADNPARDAALSVRDLSSLYYDAPSGNLLVLSDESQAVLEVTPDGRRLGRLSLRQGRHGLAHGVPQAEGMAVDASGNLYIVSEPNLFYVFRPAP